MADQYERADNAPGSRNLRMARGKPAYRWRRTDADVGYVMRRSAVVVLGSLVIGSSRNGGQAARLLAAAAAVLVARAVHGADDLGDAATLLGLMPSPPASEACIDNAVEESFPASDAPSHIVDTAVPV